MSLADKGRPEEVIEYVVPRYVPGSQTGRKTQLKPSPNCHERVSRKHVADVNTDWGDDVRRAWVVDRERARWEGADFACRVGTDPNVSLQGFAVPVGRHTNAPRKSRSHSPVRSWIIDSGSAFDIVCRSDLAAAEAEAITSNQRLTLQTANGDIDVGEATDVEVHQLSHTTDAVILDSSPSVLSVGKLNESGHGFYWPAGKVPWLTCPDGSIETLEVIDGVPQLRSRAKGNAASAAATPQPSDSVGSGDDEDLAGDLGVMVGSELSEWLPDRDSGVPTREPPPWPPGVPPPFSPPAMPAVADEQLPSVPPQRVGASRRPFD